MNPKAPAGAGVVQPNAIHFCKVLPNGAGLWSIDQSVVAIRMIQIVLWLILIS